ncbi:O-Antigen ligase [Raineyella antarctica]|uniref:O-Antigen ligase n=1 Tax=Raineyella antarctica TaxID=1577474 RepID=A0A1G6GDF1_9ACTN|nr:O-Antigen ligase [Raineyella antarctica]
MGLVCVALMFLESVTDILPDGAWFWLVTPARAVLVVGLVAMAVVAPRRAAWRTWLDVPLLVLVLTSLLASYGRADSMAGWRWLLTEVGFYYLVVIVRRTHRDTHRAALVLALTGAAVATLVALQQAAAQTPTGFCRAPGAGMADGCEQPGALVRVIGTFANPNLLAAFLLLILPLAWLAVDEWLNGSMRLVGWVLVALAALALLHTWSRAGMAAGVLGAAALVTLLRPYGLRLRRGGVLVIGGLVAAIVLVVVSGAGIRTHVWGESLRIAFRHPLGVGMGRSGALLDAAIPGSLQFQHAHNTWLNWLVEAGWIGFLAVLAITGLVCWRAWRSAREGSRIAAACGAGLLGIGMMSLADHPANSLRIALAMAFVIGLLMSSPLSDTSIRAGLPAVLAGFGRRPRAVAPLAAEVPAADRLPASPARPVGARGVPDEGWAPRPSNPWAPERANPVLKGQTGAYEDR